MTIRRQVFGDELPVDISRSSVGAEVGNRGAADVTSGMDQRRILRDWNATAVSFPNEHCIHELFEEQVRRTPGAIAAVFDQVEITYCDLNVRANQLARYLAGLGVAPDRRVGIFMDRSVELLVALLATLKAGGAYVPLEPSHPPQRLSFVLADSAPHLVLTDDRMDQSGLRQAMELAERPAMGKVELVADAARWRTAPTENLDRQRTALRTDHLAYVMYTSGSTGRPKGVLVEHRSVANLLNWLQMSYPLGGKDAVLQNTPLGFDVSVSEVFWPLIAGASVVLARPNGHKDARYLTELIELRGVTTANFVPSMLRSLLGEVVAGRCLSLKRVMALGEVLPAALVRCFSEKLPGAALHNLYGPTEATVYATAWSCADEPVGETVPIGRPIANTQTYILDGAFKPVPPGTLGELYIGGIQVARGYLNRPELTAERFLPDPFGEHAQARLYRTGDLARYRHDGAIEFMGRADQQVKVRGVRIELQEIEARLNEHPDLAEAVVIASSVGAEELRLIAYCSPLLGAAPARVSPSALRAFLARVLPEGMLPTAYVLMAALPRNANGKVQREALKPPSSDALAYEEFEAPTSDIERSLSDHWRELLKVGAVGRKDNFLALGGHSLSALRLVERLALEGIRTDVHAVLSTASLSELARRIEGAADHSKEESRQGREGWASLREEALRSLSIRRGDAPPALSSHREARADSSYLGHERYAAEEVQDAYPLTPLQEGILFHHLVGSEVDPYLSSWCMTFENRERLDAYLAAVQVVVDRHDILRTSVHWEGVSVPVQVVWCRVSVVAREVQLPDDGGESLTVLKQQVRRLCRRIDVRRAPLMQFFIARVPGQMRWMAVQLQHHLLGDAVSMRLMHREVGEVLCNRGAQLWPSVPFWRFVQQTRSNVDREGQLAFFRNLLGDMEDSTAPYGLSNVHADGHGTTEARKTLDDALGARLRDQCKLQRVSVASLFHLAWALVLARLCGRDDVVFGTVLLGRTQSGDGADGALGLFINTLPVRFRLEGTVPEGVQRMHGLLLELLQHEHTPLSLAQSCSGLAAGIPLFTTLFNYRHASNRERSRSLEGWEGIQVTDVDERTNYPVTLSVDALDDGFEIVAQAHAPARPVALQELLEKALEGLLDGLAAVTPKALTDVDVLPSRDFATQVVQWNSTATAYPRDRPLDELFAKQVRRHPSAHAVSDGKVTLSYSDVETRAERLAWHLRALGVRSGSRVALCLPCSANLIIAAVAVLKCGAAYVPFDESSPGARITFMVQDAGAEIILCLRALDLPPACAQQVRMDHLHLEAAPVAERSVSGGERSSTACVFYTSGSMGQPKGVEIPHYAIARLVLNNGFAQFEAGDHIALAANPGFDASTLELWGALLNGACSVIIEKEVLLDGERLKRVLQEHLVNVLFLPTGLFHRHARRIGPTLSTLRYLIVGGDVLEPGAAAAVLSEDGPVHFINGYGPTECTTFATTYELTKGDESAGAIPIGRPLANTRVYVLDGRGRPVPIGAAGELHIAGDGVGLGYLNRAALTAASFIADPFSRSGERMYKTGDYVRYRADGNLEFLGRVDAQVKIRGFRVEPGEVEAQLNEQPGVEQCAVVALDRRGGKQLVAYYSSDAEGEACADAVELRWRLSEVLPEYMVPSTFVRLQKLPLTQNGKIDRQALPLVAEEVTRPPMTGESPIGDKEQVLARLWCELLGVNSVSRRDGFFALGGNSLIAVSLLDRLRALGLRADMRAILTASTLADLARHIDAEPASETSAQRSGASVNGLVLAPLVQLTAEESETLARIVVGGELNIQDVYPLSALQEGMLVHHLLGGVGDPYLVRRSIRFNGRDQLERYVAALQVMIDRHDALRTSFHWQGMAKPVQVVWRRATLQVRDLSREVSPAKALEELEERSNPMLFRLDLERAPVLQLMVARDAVENHWIAIELCHHLVLDYASQRVLAIELQAVLARRALQPPVPYRALIEHTLAQAGRKQHEDFFSRLLGGSVEATLPYGLSNVLSVGALVELRRSLAAELVERTERRARVLGVSVAAIFHVAWALVLARLCGRDDVVFGTVLLGRGAGALERVVGLCINTLPIRLHVGDEQLDTAIRAAHGLLVELVQHEHAPLTLAQSCSGVGDTTLFSALLNFNSRSPLGMRAPAKELTDLGSKALTNYPLVLSVDGGEEGYELAVQVQSPIEPGEVCDLVETAVEGLVEGLEREPERRLWQLDVLPRWARQRVLVEWNGGEEAYGKGRQIHELFEEQVEKSEGAAALIYEDQVVSYGELNGRANQLAHYLRRLGVQPSARVAVCVERSVEMLVGVLSILKAGGAYVPLDPSYPMERLAYMLSDSEPELLMLHQSVDATLRGKLCELARSKCWPVIDLGSDEGWREESKKNPGRVENAVGALACVLYTSGSTGKPKGVMVEHRGVVNTLCWLQKEFGLGSGEAVLQSTPMSFDVSTSELFWPLLAGATVVMARPNGHRDPEYLAELIGKRKVTTANFVPSMLQVFLDRTGGVGCESLRRVMSLGEVLTSVLARRCQQVLRSAQLYNIYGPTEGLYCTAWNCGSEDMGSTVPIGRPLPNTRVYLLDDRKRPVPAGVVGEVYIGGEQVARGYLNRAELTAERFVEDPFVGHSGARMYKTGDLGRHRRDGVIEFLGRNDHQVKLRGMRIELGEIESCLIEHTEIREAVVLLREDGAGGQRLVAYVTRREKGENSEPPEEALPARLRAHLSASLPEHMVPGAYVVLERLPITPNGKLDRLALPLPGTGSLARAEHEAPVGAVEEKLAGLWAEILQVERVGRRDNFFALGGHSLLAVRLLEQMRRAELPVDVRALFAKPTLMSLAEAIQGGREAPEVPGNRIVRDCVEIMPEMLPLVQLRAEEIRLIVSKVPGGVMNVQDIYPLTPLQEGILFHHRMGEEGEPYLLQQLWSFERREQLEEYLGALRAVVARHDILRTSVVWDGLTEPVQVVWREAELQVQELHLDPGLGDVAEQLSARFDPQHFRLDLSQAPLLRVYFAQDAARCRWVMIELHHHLITDNVSVGLMMAEVKAHLTGQSASLGEPYPFRNLVARVRQAAGVEEQRSFFRKLLGDVDEVTAPYGLLDVHGTGGGVCEMRRRISPQLTSRLQRRAVALGVSVASVFHVAWARVLSCVSGRRDVVFGTVLLGRMQGGEGAESALGAFINTLPIRLDVGEGDLAGSIRRMHELLGELLRHEHAPLALAQRCSQVSAPTPLFTSVFNYRHARPKESLWQGHGSWQGMTDLGSKALTNYPLVLSVDGGEEGYELAVQVQSPIEPGEVCDLVETAVEGLVEGLEREPERRLWQLDVLPRWARQRVLVEWNATHAVYPEHRCLHELFEEQVEKNPDWDALLHEEKVLSFAELNASANQLGHYLKRLGVQPDTRVAICAERSAEMVWALLATLKAGGAYLPLDPTYPAERLSFMLQQSSPIVVLVHALTPAVLASLRFVADELRIRVIDLQADAQQWVNASTVNIERASTGVTSRHLAYVMYTSGSTGQPKGVMIEHHAVVNLLHWMQSEYGLKSGEPVLQSTPFSFDVSVWELFWPLCNGGRLILAREGGQREPAYLARLICRHEITTAHFVPSLLAIFLEQPEAVLVRSLHRVICIGEVLPAALARRFAERLPWAGLHNLYGPTETTVYVSAWACAAEPLRDNVPIGRPIWNTQMYVLDEFRQPVPAGVPGELYIGGVQVARGYSHRPELTRERFVSDPFSASEGARMYKTGDLARFRQDGAIEFLGRNDSQVKLRGYRIELGEIEARLAEVPAIQECAVIILEGSAGDARLVAYYTALHAIPTTELRLGLERVLPDYMVPSSFVQLAQLPLTPNGKLDRKALPTAVDPGGSLRPSYVEPRTPEERVFARIWAEVLGVQDVGIHDDFFELGGQSLSAMTVISRIRSTLGVEIELAYLFEFPTIVELIGVLHMDRGTPSSRELPVPACTGS